jgi:hypothetical protein
LFLHHDERLKHGGCRAKVAVKATTVIGFEAGAFHGFGTDL